MEENKKRLLRAGAKGKLVLEIQKRLKEMGFDPGIIDGIFGPGTDEAVRLFQERAQLKADGVRLKGQIFILDKD
jgi:peptidoglycan hydrolase-like protein with peptidoglycan-binding domain